jgi:hypothetical protein
VTARAGALGTAFPSIIAPSSIPDDAHKQIERHVERVAGD